MSPRSEEIDSKEKKKELKNGWWKENLRPCKTKKAREPKDEVGATDTDILGRAE